MTVRGGGVPACAMAFVPRKRMGPPPRSFAADAHDCIMVRVLGPTEYKVVARLIRAPESGLPSDRHPVRIERPPCSELSRYGLATAERVERRRPTLTAPARAGFAIRRVGTKKRDSRSNKETDQGSKKDRALKPLDNNDPIQGTSGYNCEAESTDAPVRGGLLRSSVEAGVILAERRERVIAIGSGQPATGGTRCSMEGGSLHAMARAG
jgi:hypothetical protein